MVIIPILMFSSAHSSICVSAEPISMVGFSPRYKSYFPSSLHVWLSLDTRDCEFYLLGCSAFLYFCKFSTLFWGAVKLVGSCF